MAYNDSVFINAFAFFSLRNANVFFLSGLRDIYCIVFKVWIIKEVSCGQES